MTQEETITNLSEVIAEQNQRIKDQKKLIDMLYTLTAEQAVKITKLHEENEKLLFKLGLEPQE
jgi:uncharacterized coiled-coil protein SlyX